LAAESLLNRHANKEWSVEYKKITHFSFFLEERERAKKTKAKRSSVEIMKCSVYF